MPSKKVPHILCAALTFISFQSAAQLNEQFPTGAQLEAWFPTALDVPIPYAQSILSDGLNPSRNLGDVTQYAEFSVLVNGALESQPLVPVGPRIFGGRPALPEEARWQVGLLYTGGVGAAIDSLFCGGVLVDQSIVLTAAHCVVNLQPQAVQVVAGSQNLGRYRELIDVSRIVWHGSYNPATLENDIAILELVDSARVTPIQRLSASFRETLDDQDLLTVAGWGVTEEGRRSPLLRVVDVPYVNGDRCGSDVAYGSRYKPGMFCAGYDEGIRDACRGDSGSGIYLRNDNGTNVLAGLVSWGDGCGQPFRYGVYTDINEYAAWIDENM